MAELRDRDVALKADENGAVDGGHRGNVDHWDHQLAQPT